MGFLRPNGGLAITPQFQDARSFSEGLAEVQLSDGGWGYVNKDGTLVIPADFVETTSFQRDSVLSGVTSLKATTSTAMGRRFWLSIFGHSGNSDGLTVAGQQGERKYVDRAGKVVAPYEGP